MSPITTGVRPPARSRTFTERDARVADETLKQYAANGQTGEGVGYGDFNSEESARSAATALNKMILDLGLSTTKWASTVFKVDVEVPEVDGDGEPVVDAESGEQVVNIVTKHRGVLLPKAAKPAPKPAAKKSGGRKSRS